MKINTAPTHQAVLSNVESTGQFVIKASSHSFQILSAGLYSNKIRAIIRELTTNAIDSHVAANTTRPVEVHLPTSMEPRFSVRDYGTGLYAHEVTGIYTTYFESTKTNSNDFVGALGLGSKSPFSYTDNFTITAIKNGVQRIYTAYINEQGVPSIALMLTNETNELDGVEVEFAVNESRDFRNFASEASEVFSWFQTKPLVLNDEYYRETRRALTHENIIPGVHQADYKTTATSSSCAVMGHIAYPISIPTSAMQNRDQALFSLLNHNLILHFDIGALEFQPSREGLRYERATVDAIEQRLIELRNSMLETVVREADACTNSWERAQYLYDLCSRSDIWIPAVEQYVTDTGFELLSVRGRQTRYQTYPAYVDEIEKKFNIRLRAFTRDRGSIGCQMINPVTENSTSTPGKTRQYHAILRGNPKIRFVIQDTKAGIIEKAKRHYRVQSSEGHAVVYVLVPADRNAPMDTAGFFSAMHNPPSSTRILGSTLVVAKDAADPGAAPVAIFSLQRRGGRSRLSANVMVWREAPKKLDEFDKTKTYYYFNLSGLSVVSKFEGIVPSDVFISLQSIGAVELSDTLYGVRKSDQGRVAAMPNWICLDNYVPAVLGASDPKKVDSLVNAMFHTSYGCKATFQDHLDPNSPLQKLIAKFKGKQCYGEHAVSSYRHLARIFTNNRADTVYAAATAKFNKVSALLDRYGMLWQIHSSRSIAAIIKEYVALVDASLTQEQLARVEELIA